ncbi:hypothetical protein JOD63_002181 [Microbacterium terrae]|uniref:GerMN domain-containing protein n=1 Tax=Microbacterium terrae TaxID=69369 RepID=A0A0M2H9U2_9MICO|nr:hypothetical protein [Microbacterium terrae]KJL40924.1 hypothetical protein RS81_01468 [Microbacterium terrae]MBP1078213.1 hypothetical protein [Microbacterium terrae]GLJ97692.1 hypothetical protein GCM10017594_08890 [Microbacterium terrae]
MARQSKGMRLLPALVLAGALLGGALAGCGVVPQGTQNSEEATVDYGDVAEAVTTAVPRVVAVEDPSRWKNGFGHGLALSLVTDSAEPFTAEELDAVVETVWRTLPWEPNTIELIAGTVDAGDPVDLRAAAADLDQLVVRNAGQGGVTLTGMDARYGDWAAPE